MRSVTLIASWLLAAAMAAAQDEPQQPTAPSGTPAAEPTAGEEPAPPPPAAEDEPVEREWSVGASLATYVIPEDRDYVQPTFELDYRWVHFEARYNYEALDAASTWLGYNFAIGETVTFEATPMVGFVFGHQLGVAPGYKFALGWWWLELYSEGEYVIDVEHVDDSFFYTWSELTLSPLEWLRFGLVTQRTRAYETDVDIQRGFLVGLSYKVVDFAANVFNLGWDDPTFVFSLGLSF